MILQHTWQVGPLLPSVCVGRRGYRCSFFTVVMFNDVAERGREVSGTQRQRKQKCERDRWKDDSKIQTVPQGPVSEL